MIYFTSDLHLGHNNILKYQRKNRPFESVEHMNEHIIKTINTICSEDDELYVLGDITVSQAKWAFDLIKTIKPRLSLVRGNHDRWKPAKEEELFERVWDYRVVHYNQERIVCFHFPIEEWEMCQRGAIHLHGHSHGSLWSTRANRFDIGWDVWKHPISIEEVLSWKDTNPNNWQTHHGVIEHEQHSL